MNDDLVLAYLTTRRSELEKLRDLLDHGRLHEMKRIAHQLKGSGASYGFPRLTQIGRELERAVATDDPAMARSCLEHLELELAVVAADA